MADAIIAGVLFHPFMEVATSLYIDFSSHNSLYVILVLMAFVRYSDCCRLWIA